MNRPRREILYKVLVVGDIGVGKTSVIRRYVNGGFSNQYKTTIGVDFAMKTIQLDDMIVRLQLWDIAGQERFGSMTRVYYKEAVAALIVFDLSRFSTLDSVRSWKEDIDSKVRLNNEENIPVILVGNKSDISPHLSKVSEIEEACEECGFLRWFPTSAKEGNGIEEMMNYLISVVRNVEPEESDPHQSVRLTTTKNDTRNNEECC
eukprot:TRINITY_DN6263_c0_g1_i1.p2 TRINITY_DN6263_c0_g1~~TRINITY_DN6263_c0_g1_i1.p2  ORF type:complete len:205 (+),score=45.63 TRINITY_DN6263_c0_g1_i1:619-1233(+)